MTDESTILAANAAFYIAFANADVDAMGRLWADDDAISCIHPGWPAIIGRTAVVGSWRSILEGARAPAITCHDPHAIITGDEGRVLCVEMIGPLALAASNHFRRIGEMWRLVHHQSSPIARAEGHASRDEFPPPEHIH
ncbi:MAG TPA: nuclear transport factor 2 family protein [Methylocella sp.]|nr:nuclear transport factor 2 family protein [Methylocella sp.]